MFKYFLKTIVLVYKLNVCPRRDNLAVRFPNLILTWKVVFFDTAVRSIRTHLRRVIGKNIYVSRNSSQCFLKWKPSSIVLPVAL